MWQIKSTNSWSDESSWFPRKWETMEEAEVMLDAIVLFNMNNYRACAAPHNRMTCSKATYGGLGWNGGPRAPLIPEYYFRLDGQPYMRILIAEVEDEEPVDDRPKRRRGIKNE